jgi:PAS domain S-box-containing protein
LALLRELKSACPEALGIVLTGNASVSNAIEALNRGAYAYLLKDSGIDELLSVIRRAVDHARLSRENRGLASSLLASEQKYRDLIENSPDMVHVLDAEGRFVESNRTEIERLGYSLAALKGRDFLTIVDEAHRDRTRAHLREVRERGISRAESRLVTRSGETIDVEMFATVQQGQAGIGAGSIRCFVRDISEWKRVQRTLAEKERLAAIGQMSATIAHEVRNPLAGISGAIQVLFSQLATDPKKAEILREILARIDRLNAIITDLLQFAKPLSPSLKPVKFEALARAALDVLARDPVMSDVQVRVEDLTQGRVFLWDPAQLEMALTNLVLNAAHAMKGHGRIRLVGRRAGGEVVIEVDDSGPGFRADALERAFTPFFTTKVKGTGLGLAVTRKIVEAHAGTIRVRNKSGAEGTGAAIEITLPEAARSEAAR